MKHNKTIIIFFAALVLSLILQSAFILHAAEPTCTLTGPSSVRAGDTVTLSFKVTGTNLLAMRVKVSFDGDELTYRSEGNILSNWSYEVEGTTSDTVMLWFEEDNNLKSGINSKTQLFTISFIVKSDVSTGTDISVSAVIIDATDYDNSFSNISSSYKTTVARPYSNNASLSSLTINDYGFDKTFSADVTEYTVPDPVDYTTVPVTVACKTADSGASAEASGTRLAVGENTVRVTVTAEDGKATRTYTVRITMMQDPDYIPSPDATLSALNISSGSLSPSFDANITKYIVYVPYETETFTISGTANDKLGSGVPEQTVALEPGENIIAAVSVSESGVEVTYTVTVVRMPRYAPDETTEQTETTTEAPTETDTAATETETEPPETSPVTDSVTTEAEETADASVTTDSNTPVTPDKTVPLWLVFVAAVGGIILGTLGAAIVLKLQ